MSRPAANLRQRPAGPASTGVRAYVVLCLVALGGVWITQVEQGAGLGGVLVLLIGLVGLATRAQSAPLLYLLVFAAQQALQFLTQPYFRGFMRRGGDVSEVFVSGLVLAYVIGHYRLQGLLQSVVPLDPRRRAGPPRWHLWRFRWLPRLVPQRRSPRGVAVTELPLLLLTLPATALAAQALWRELLPHDGPLGLSPGQGRLLVLAWCLALGLLIVAAFLRQWQRRRMTPDEATLLLQDVLWNETRREQRRINRWLAWSRLRKRQEGA
jgi:hypothetical protein